MVKKRDGRCEELNRDKLLNGILKACQKRPVSQDGIDNLADGIMEDLSNTFEREIPSVEIGKRVMQGLRGLDGVAYVRYASVYRRFEEATEFVSEVKKLETKNDTLTARLPGI